MSNGGRKVSTDALETLGTIIDDTQKRDAIHLAVVPMVATVRLYPGQDVGPVEGGAGPTDMPQGIVDPFLKTPVQPGQRFWFVLYPRTVTSLRHVWTHPAFEGAEERGSETGTMADELERLKAASREYMSALADRLGVSSRRLLEGARAHVEDGDYLIGGSEMEGEHTPDDFWLHYEVLTGENVEKDKRDNFFSCSC